MLAAAVNPRGAGRFRADLFLAKRLRVSASAGGKGIYQQESVAAWHPAATTTLAGTSRLLSPNLKRLFAFSTDRTLNPDQPSSL